MTTPEQQLKELLFPDKPLNAESVERDLLKPLGEISEVINVIREKISLELLKESVRLNNDAEVKQRSVKLSEEVKKAISELSTLKDGLTVPLDDLVNRVNGLVDKVELYMESQGVNQELEASVLLKLNAYLDKAG